MLTGHGGAAHCVLFTVAALGVSCQFYHLDIQTKFTSRNIIQEIITDFEMSVTFSVRSRIKLVVPSFAGQKKTKKLYFKALKVFR